MTEVLHLQSRAYPLHYALCDPFVDTIRVPGRGEFHPVAGELSSAAYNAITTVEADLTAIVKAGVNLPGTEIVGCRARFLSAGTVLVVYALRHNLDLGPFDAYQLADFDARVNRSLRSADATVLAEVFDAARRAGLLGHIIPPPRGGRSGERPFSIDPRFVRYNCHLVTRRPDWSPDPRVPQLVLGPGCQVLLPFTYAWDGDPSAPLDEILTLLEPADIAVAELSLLIGAITGGRQILADLARDSLSQIVDSEFRRFIDGVWANYHELDSYRVESAQDRRATFLAAREIIGVDQAHDRAERLLQYAGTSLLAEATSRTEHLDKRLNRVAAGLTVVAAQSFLLDLAGFVLPQQTSLPVRLAIVGGVTALGAAAVMLTLLPRWKRRRARDTVADAVRRPGAIAAAGVDSIRRAAVTTGET
ncbi:hypothetical protein ACL02O_25555 [Micromonospora sp. MS34]|uniref:hypothetical protein n=1 Tax=Micromonospora sp. MS34 TaxID=3385971 RepID=UPI00399F1102